MNVLGTKNTYVVTNVYHLTIVVSVARIHSVTQLPKNTIVVIKELVPKIVLESFVLRETLIFDSYGVRPHLGLQAAGLISPLQLQTNKWG